MIEQVDLRVHDRVALDEIELYTDVLSAVAASDRPLTDEELDRVLGVSPRRSALLGDPADPPSRVAEHDVGAVVRKAQRLVQPDRGRIRLVNIEHGPGEPGRL
jgi:hypothetical protein